VSVGKIAKVDNICYFEFCINIIFVAIFNVVLAMEQIAAGYSVIVWGDFNDYDVEDASLDLMDHKPISNVLANLRLLDRNTELADLVNVIPVRRQTETLHGLV
jgi:hypothetical protein